MGFGWVGRYLFINAWELRSCARRELILRTYLRALAFGRASQQVGHHWESIGLEFPQEQKRVGLRFGGMVEEEIMSGGDGGRWFVFG